MLYATTNLPEILAAMERDRAWLARKMGVSLSLVCYVIDGKRTITPNFVDRACRALNLPASAIFVPADTRMRIPEEVTYAAS